MLLQQDTYYTKKTVGDRTPPFSWKLLRDSPVPHKDETDGRRTCLKSKGTPGKNMVFQLPAEHSSSICQEESLFVDNRYTIPCARSHRGSCVETCPSEALLLQKVSIQMILSPRVTWEWPRQTTNMLLNCWHGWGRSGDHSSSGTCNQPETTSLWPELVLYAQFLQIFDQPLPCANPSHTESCFKPQTI